MEGEKSHAVAHPLWKAIKWNILLVDNNKMRNSWMTWIFMNLWSRPWSLSVNLGLVFTRFYRKITFFKACLSTIVVYLPHLFLFAFVHLIFILLFMTVQKVLLMLFQIIKFSDDKKIPTPHHSWQHSIWICKSMTNNLASLQYMTVIAFEVE